jgi:diguanylate cyclase (GGDEF)-like protein
MLQNIGGSDAMSMTFRKVVVVEGDAVTLRLISKFLIDAGYEVSGYSNAEDALEFVQTNCPDFLVTDWHMRSMTGIELVQRIRELQLPHYIYTVLLTSSIDRNGMVTSLEAGADDYLTKPVIREELLAILRAGARIRVMEQRLKFLASHDALTGVPNRRSLFDFLDKEWSRSVRHGTSLACIMVDVDFFKSVNDTYGHPFGDTVLQAIAKRLVDACRDYDSVFRFGGEEFCIVLPETSEDGAMLCAERCRANVMATPVVSSETSILVTASFGVGFRSDDMATPTHLINSADNALLIAKKSGRNQVVCDRSNLAKPQPPVPPF